MKNSVILRAIGGIDEELIERAAPNARKSAGGKSGHITAARWLRWAAPLAACIAIAAAVTLPKLWKSSDYSASAPGSARNTGEIGDAMAGGGEGFSAAQQPAETDGGVLPPPGLSLDGEPESAACYTAPGDWRGLPAVDILLDEKTDNGVAADRAVYQSLSDLAAVADAFALVANVREVKAESDNMQTAIIEYAETIGGVLYTREWNDVTVSTGNRALVRQELIGGCSMLEPNNLLRGHGVYVLPLVYNEYYSAYEIVGNFDVLFELDDKGQMHSHSRFPELNQYDGVSLPDFLDEVRGLYPAPDVEFNEQHIGSVEQAERQLNDSYILSGFRKFSAEFEAETTVEGADVYLFKVALGDNGASGFEYAAIAENNGAFVRLIINADAEYIILGGLGSYPKNSSEQAR